MLKAYTEFLFWFHLSLIAAAIIISYFLPPYLTLLWIIGHEIQVSIFKGCLLTSYEKYLGGIPQKDEFFQYAARKLFRKKISKQACNYINYAILVLSLTVSLLHPRT